MIKKLSFFVLFLSLLPTLYVSAEMTIEATYGIDGTGKMYTPIRAEVTVTNAEEAFSGHLVTSFKEGYQLQAAEVLPLELASGEQVTLEFYLTSYPEGLYYNNEPAPFTLYEGAVAEGKVVKDVTIQETKPKLFNYEALVVGTYSEDESFSTLQQLRSLTDREVLVEKLSQFQQDKRDYAMYDLLLFDTSFQSLSEQEQEALVEWIKAGGQLILDGTVDGTSLEKYAALSYTQGTTELSVEEVKAFAKGGTFTAPLTMRNAVSSDEAQSIKQGEKIVAAMRPIEKGKLIQTAFQLSDGSLLSMDGYSHLIAQVISLQDYEWGKYPETKNDQIANALAKENELFPSFIFSIWKVVGVLLLYIIIVSPVLYIILRKKDKREHAWWLVPAIAIVFSLAFFLVGAKDRLWKPQLQELMLWTVSDEGSEQYFTQSLLANKAGDYEFKLDPAATVTAYHTGGAPNDVSQLSYRDGDTFTLKGIPYWGLKSLIGFTTETEEGYFEQQLRFENQQLTGTVTNHFPFTVDNVQIWTGSAFHQVGTIAQGETVEVDFRIDSGYLVGTKQIDYDYYMRNVNIEEMRQNGLLRLAHNRLGYMEKPLLLANAAEATIPSALTKEAKKTSTVLIAQPLAVTSNYVGDITLTNENLQREVVYQGQYSDWLASDMTTWYLDSNIQELRYHLPKALEEVEIEWQELSVTNQDARMEVQILNSKTGESEPLTEQIQKNPVHYITEDGRIIFEVKWALSEMAAEVTLPEITLKGEMK